MPTLCVYVYVYVLIFEGVCKRHHAHITIERLPRQLLPRCLQCLLEYGRRRINTCPIFPQSPPIRIGPRTSTGSVAAGWHGLALLQLLPLVSNKHMISLLQKRCATFGTCGLGGYVVMDWHRCGLTFIALSHAHSHSHIIILPQSLPCCLFILCAHIATCVHAGCCYVYTMQPFDNHVVIAASAHTDVDPSLLVQVGRCEISQASPVHNLQEPRRDFPQ